MPEISVKKQGNIKNYLTEISKMKVSELEFFAQELNAIIVRKRSKTKKAKIAKLYQLINETVLDKDKKVIFDLLADKFRENTISEAELNVYQNIINEEENLRNQRIKYMIELSQLREIPFTDLMVEMGLKNLPHG